MPSLNLADLFEIVVDAVPERTALLAGDVRLSFSALDKRANRMANHLLSLGIQPEEKVGIYAYNRAEWVECLWACFKIRAVPVNVNFRYVEEELLYIFDDADVTTMIFERSFSPLLCNIKDQVADLKHYIVLEDGSDADSSALNASHYEDALAAASDQRNFPARSANDIYMLYTGGTTGMPKGTLWRHEDIFYAALQGGNPGGEPIKTPEELGALARASEAPYAALCPAPMMHGSGEWYCMIYQLSANTFALYTERSYDADKILQLIEQEKILNLFVVGDAMARPVADAIATGKYDTSSLFVIGSGGAMLSKTVKNQLKELLPNAIIMDSFGASETGSGGAVMDLDKNAAGPMFTLAANTAILGDDLRPLPPGSEEIGLLARCGHIPLGYHKDEEKTAKTFKVDPDGKRWVIPGDYAKVLEDGTAVLLGRGSGCINSGGEKIFPEEVEAALKAHPAIFNAGVAGVSDERFGEKVVALIQTKDRKTVDTDELDAFCRTKVAGYKTPRKYIQVDEIPKTATGKPDYKKIKEVAQSQGK